MSAAELSQPPVQGFLFRIRSLMPGAVLCVVVALAASFLSEHYGGPAMLFALLLGMAFNYQSENPSAAAGIRFCSKAVLRVGIVLLGARITVTEVAALGPSTVLLVVAGVALTMSVGFLIARMLRLPADLAILSAGSVAICGASAALALSAVLPRSGDSERNTIITVVGVTSLSTIAMMVYPILSGFAEFDSQAAGIFLGATIHDVAQVIGAGYMVSPETGDTAAIVKLLRVACLLPAVLSVGLIYGRKRRGEADSPALLPWFLLAFAGMVAVNSVVTLPAALTGLAGEASRWCILIAVSALGVRTSLRELTSVGPKPLVALILQSVLLAAFVALGIGVFI